MPEREIADLISYLQLEYLYYAACAELVDNPAAKDLVQQVIDGGGRLLGMQRSNGYVGTFFGIDSAIPEPPLSAAYQASRNRLWFAGALITLGDALVREGNLDQGPDLELIRHLRNGVAHGNQFNLLHGEPKRTAKYTGPPQEFENDGRTRLATPIQGTVFEITPALNGQAVLFDFIGPGDLYELLMFVGWRLARIADGAPPKDMWPQTP